MTDAEFWEIERSLWLGGSHAFKSWVAAECLMVFPEPAGIMTNPAILESVATRPRWESLEITGALLRRTGTEAAVLAYRAEALRADGAPYRALCSSGYVRQAGDWWLVQHQQTPL
jgi:Domain of unknown function (DUF4440)